MKNETLNIIDTNNQKALSILKGILKIAEDESMQINLAGIARIDGLMLIESAVDFLEDNNRLFDESTLPGALDE